ncbi:MAG: phosphopantothenoylcysteine decarboxylase [Planctomycetaceae bacterium]|nr:phosphopantothenoylcysteine decarboxylase [Planctomycetaceae bacterium]
MNGREIVVGVTGGIAAYKTAALVSQLVQAGAGVTVVTTAAAEQFVGAATFAALTGRPVARKVFDEAQFPLGAHIELAERAELLIVAPASADFLAKAAHGLADDLLSTLYLAFTGRVLVAPAMNTAMWEKQAVQRNVAQLRADGVQFIDPESGWLSCRQVGAGRMAAPEKIVEVVKQLLVSRGS